MMNRLTSHVRLGTSLIATIMAAASQAETRRVWEKVEITLRSQRSYQNPYTDVQVWLDLQGPGFEKRCYGFWDGGSTFRVRILATAPGRWTWESDAHVVDPGLQGIRGEFTAIPWTEAELDENPCRRGMVQPSGNGHAFEYADGTPFFLLGDTWWATPTSRCPWYDDDRPRPLPARTGRRACLA
jgi:hypothetical protein